MRFNPVILSYGCLLLLRFSVPSESMSSDKQIVNAAKNPEALGSLQMMPGGDVLMTVEYDLLLSIAEYRELHRSQKRQNRHKRKASSNLAHRWTDCIVYYEFDESLDKNTNEVIREAIKEWETYTCLTFRYNRTSPNRIQFKDGDGCKSRAGMQMYPQPLYLARGCRTKGIIAHEIGHAIGFWHEHMRPDRDEYIQVNFDVIERKYISQYKKYDTDVIDTYGEPYDYTSLMHYGNNVIPNSIKTLNPEFQERIGQRDGLTFHDIALANKMYNCSSMCRGQRRSCPQGGFRLKGKHEYSGCECWCNSGDLKKPLKKCNDEPGPVPPQPVTTMTPPPTVTMGCFDMHDDCEAWKKDDKCMTSMELMMEQCAKTCGTCGKGKGMCMDHDKHCPMLTTAGWCSDPEFGEYMSEMCPGSCGLCSKPPDPCHIMEEILGPHPSSGAVSVMTMPVVLYFFVLSCFIQITGIR